MIAVFGEPAGQEVGCTSFIVKNCVFDIVLIGVFIVIYVIIKILFIYFMQFKLRLLIVYPQQELGYALVEVHWCIWVLEWIKFEVRGAAALFLSVVLPEGNLASYETGCVQLVALLVIVDMLCRPLSGFAFFINWLERHLHPLFWSTLSSISTSFLIAVPESLFVLIEKLLILVLQLLLLELLWLPPLIIEASAALFSS
jgi:hypothetical protein